MPPENVDDIYPLTPMQRLMLLHAVARPDAAVLVNAVLYDIRGTLRPDLFRQACQALVSRHPALRTAVLWDGLDTPVQVVRTCVDLPFTELDVSAEPAEGRRARIESVWRDACETPFELPRAPLMRCVLVHIAEDHHLLVWVIHHLVVDRWSHGVVLSDLAELYRALLEGEEPRLRPAVPFRAYAAWLRDRPAEAGERFWRKELDGVRRATLLADDGRDPTGERQTTRHTIPPEVVDRMDTRASSWRVGPATVLLAGVAMEVAVRTGSRDVLFGLAVSGRPPDLDRVEEVVGSFVNNVPLRIRFDGEATLSAWGRRIAKGHLQRQPFEHVSPATIRDQVDLPSSHPLFDLLVVPNLTPVESPAWSGLEVRRERSTFDASYPLVLGVERTGDGLELALVHDPSFDAEALLAGVAARVRAVSEAPAEAPVATLLPRGLGSAKPAERSREPGPARTRAGLADDPSLQEAIRTIWREVLGVERVGLDDDFFDLGGTSLQAARLFSRVERLAGRGVPISSLLEATTVRKLVEALDEPARFEGSVVPLTTGGEGRPAFILPSSIGDVVAAGLLPLARALDSSRSVYGLQSRGLDGRTEPLASIKAIADDFADQILDVGEDGPHLVGICWGAAVMLETARSLRARGRPVGSLSLVSPAVLPDRTGQRPRRSLPSPVTQLVLGRLGLYWRELVEGSWDERREWLARKARIAGRMLQSREEREKRQLVLARMEVKRVNRLAFFHYRAERLEARATVFLPGDLEGPEDPRLDWIDLLEPRPAIVAVPGANLVDALVHKADALAAALGGWWAQAES